MSQSDFSELHRTIDLLQSELADASDTMTQLREQLYDPRFRYDVEDPCTRCDGSGRRAYGSTATWRGGIGGQTITMDLCDHCWGSGELHRPFRSLRKIYDERVESVKRAQDLEKKYNELADAISTDTARIIAITKRAIEIAGGGHSLESAIELMAETRNTKEKK